MSGPLIDRIDLPNHVPPVSAADLAPPPPPDGSAEVAARVAAARAAQVERATRWDGPAPALNAQADGDFLDKAAGLDDAARSLMARAADAGHLTARGWTRALRLARTIADLDGADAVKRVHVAEALIYRRVGATPPAPVGRRLDMV